MQKRLMVCFEKFLNGFGKIWTTKITQQGKFFEFWVSSFNQFSSKLGYVPLKFLLLFISNFISVMLTSGVKILSSPLLAVYKLSRENTQPENMCDVVFDKAKGRGGTVNRKDGYAQAAIQQDSI